MTIDAKIFNLNFSNPKLVELVIRKKKQERFYQICFIGFGSVIETIKSLGLEKTDKVRIGYTLMSKKYVGKDGNSRYSTSAIIDRIELLEKNINRQTEVIFVDSQTGEIIPNEQINN